jgi:dTDP-4-dehydrorhamnose reductase
VLITGGGGQLASDLEALLQEHAHVFAPSHAILDITDEDALRETFEVLRPTVVINCAAFHNVEACERESDRAFAVNACAVKRLAQSCAHWEAQLVHLSTNYVFDGLAAEPYEEDACPNPRSVYAISKLAGEQAALAYAPRTLVVRTAGLYGLHGSASKGGNFVTRMLARAREEGKLSVVADQRLTPTSTADLAAAIIAAADRRVTGILHLTNAGATTWHGFTEAILAIAGLDVQVRPTTTARVRGAADRPLNGLLSSRVAVQAGLEPLRPWRDALADHLGGEGIKAAPARQVALSLRG